MERIDISEDRRFARWIDTVERGEKVEFVDGETVVGEVNLPKQRPVIDLEKLAALHAELGAARGGGAALIRALRDEERF